MVRAKFQVESITTYPGQAAKSVKLRAICDNSTEENKRFSKYTPNGALEMWIDNPEAMALFEENKVFYLDFTPAV